MSELTPERRQQIFEEEKARHEAQQKLKKEEEAKNLKTGCLGFIIMVALIALLLSCCDGDSPKEPKAPDKLDAYVMSQLFVQDKLKSPSSADFPVFSEKMVVDMGDGGYLVSAYVDSQNSFGATLRTKYSCLLQYDKESDEWKLKDIALK